MLLTYDIITKTVIFSCNIKYNL